MQKRTPRSWARTVSIAALFAAALLVAACNGDAPEITAPGDTDLGSSAEAAINDADVAFLQGMIPHHRQAVEMSQLVPERTDRAELAQLAADIIASQEAEIAVMEGMLDDAGVSLPEGMSMDMEGMDQAGMSGMMSDEQMSRLAELDDVEFDLLFLDMMIEHHEGAIESADQVISDGEHPELRQLAEDIIAEQETEIAQMRTWREDWAAEAS